MVTILMVTTESLANNRSKSSTRSSATHILLVEDDVDFRESMRELLKSEGYRVTTAENGQIALDILSSLPDPPDLVLLDLMMPVMDGWTFLKRRQAEPGLVDCPVVLLSGVADLCSDPILSEVTACLVKPIDIERLLQVLDEVS